MTNIVDFQKHRSLKVLKWFAAKIVKDSEYLLRLEFQSNAVASDQGSAQLFTLIQGKPTPMMGRVYPIEDLERLVEYVSGQMDAFYPANPLDNDGRSPVAAQIDILGRKAHLHSLYRKNTRTGRTVIKVRFFLPADPKQALLS
jgi:hypothetical protein